MTLPDSLLIKLLRERAVATDTHGHRTYKVHWHKFSVSSYLSASLPLRWRHNSTRPITGLKRDSILPLLRSDQIASSIQSKFYGMVITLKHTRVHTFHARVLLIDGFEKTTDVQQLVLLQQACVKGRQMAILIVNPAHKATRNEHNWWGISTQHCVEVQFATIGGCNFKCLLHLDHPCFYGHPKSTKQNVW
jgi:hypothetical protein